MLKVRLGQVRSSWPTKPFQFNSKFSAQTVSISLRVELTAKKLIVPSLELGSKCFKKFNQLSQSVVALLVNFTDLKQDINRHTFLTQVVCFSI